MRSSILTLVCIIMMVLIQPPPTVAQAQRQTDFGILDKSFGVESPVMVNHQVQITTVQPVVITNLSNQQTGPIVLSPPRGPWSDSGTGFMVLSNFNNLDSPNSVVHLSTLRSHNITSVIQLKEPPSKNYQYQPYKRE